MIDDAFQKWLLQKWARRQWSEHREDVHSYPLCPACEHHDAHLFCGACLRWFCRAHLMLHSACVRVELPHLNEFAKGGL